MTTMNEPSRPALRDPDCGPYVADDDDVPFEHGVGWDVSEQCRVTFSPEAHGFDVTVSTSGEEQEMGWTARSVTADQIRDFARKLLALVGDEGAR